MKPLTHFKAPGAPKIAAQAPKTHPASVQALKTRVRLPDTGSIGADQAPFSPTVGRF